MARLTAQSYTKIILILVLGGLLCGALAFGSCSGWRFSFGGSNFGFGGGALAEIGNAEVDTASVKNLEVNWAAGSVDIKTHSGKSILLTETASDGMAKAQAMRWQVIDDTLQIDYGQWVSCMSLHSKHLEILIPESLAKNLGNVRISGASGDYEVGNLTCNELSLDLASGTFNANDVIASSLGISVASGNSYFEGEVANKVKIDTASGESTVILHTECPNTIDADIASGTVTISIPENDGFTAHIDRLSGNFQSDFETRRSGDSDIYKDGNAAINADMASGQFILKRTPELYH